jgi:hypothetical protein
MDTQDLVEYMSVRQKAYQTQGWQPLVVAGLFTRDYCGARSGCRNWQPSRASPRRPDFTIVGCCHTWVATFSCCWLGGPASILVLVSPDGRYLALSTWCVYSVERPLHRIRNRNDGRGGNSIGTRDCGLFSIEVPPFGMGPGKHLHCSHGGSTRLLPSQFSAGNCTPLRLKRELRELAHQNRVTFPGDSGVQHDRQRQKRIDVKQTGPGPATSVGRF